MENVTSFVTSLWLVWLVLLFVGIVAWVYWPSRRRRKQMQDHAEIPFREAPPKREEPEDKPDAPGSRNDKKDG
jgi:cytochrome c oxidase cbb3-type subunit 4